MSDKINIVGFILFGHISYASTKSLTKTYSIVKLISQELLYYTRNII